eukprot:m.758780 g.758780  ORF g.758780 m.758780 type:complete len:466 (+) comp23193_c0_seq28:232-1629(+)
MAAEKVTTTTGNDITFATVTQVQATAKCWRNQSHVKQTIVTIPQTTSFSVDERQRRKRPSRIPPEQFYQNSKKADQDAEWSKRLKSIQRRAKEISSLPPLPHIVPEDLRKRRAIWKEFYRQDDAFEFTKTVRSGVHTFSFEVPGMEGGKRRFIAANYSTFWEKYKNIPATRRHFYEVIPEWSPCKLYFDLEYKRANESADDDKKDYNPEPHVLPGRTSPQMASDDTLVENVISTVQAVLQLPPYKTTCNRKNVLDLDSSTKQKFSRHLIFTDVIFADNREMGVFVSAVVHKILQSQCAADTTAQDAGSIYLGKNAREDNITRAAAHLVLPDDTGAPQTIIDEGVYTRNRNFRLFLSSKIAKGVVLAVAAANQYPHSLEEEYCFDNCVLFRCDALIVCLLASSYCDVEKLKTCTGGGKTILYLTRDTGTVAATSGKICVGCTRSTSSVSSRHRETTLWRVRVSVFI